MPKRTLTSLPGEHNVKAIFRSIKWLR